MKVELVADEDAPGVTLLLLEGEVAHKLHGDIYGKSPKLPAKIHSLEELEEVFAQWSKQQVKRFLIKKLSHRNYLQAEIRHLLQERLVDDQLINKLLDEFQMLGYIDDHLTVESIIAGQKSKGKGVQAIRHQLMKKGLTSEESAVCVEEKISEYDQIASIVKQIQRKFSKLDSTQPAAKQKIVAFFFRKGFKLEHIRQALDSLNH